jgi:hypothetical protein
MLAPSLLARLVLAGLLLTSGLAAAQGVKQKEIFHIERSKNRNVVRYDARIGKDGRLDPKEPVVCYWLGPNGKRWPVSFVDRTFFYGFKVQKDKSGAFYHLVIAAAKDRPMKLYLKEGQPRAEGRIGGVPAFLQRLYVRFDEKSTLPSVRYVDLIGVDARTGEPRRDRVIP